MGECKKEYPPIDSLTAYPPPLALDPRKTSINSNEKWEIWINLQFIILFPFYSCIFRRIMKLNSRCWRCENEKTYTVCINSNATEYEIVWLLFSHENWNLFIYIISIIRMNETLSIPIGVSTASQTIQKSGFHYNSTSDKEYIALWIICLYGIAFSFRFASSSRWITLQFGKSNDLSEFLSCFSRPLH